MHFSEYNKIEELEEVHFWYSAMEKYILDVLENTIKKKVKILDAGCGTGGLSQKMMKFGYVAAIDISPVALEFAKKKKISRVFKGSVESIPFKENSFDIVVCLDVLYHRKVKDDIKAFNEFYRILKPNGILILRLPAFELLRGAHDRVVETRHRYTLLEVRSKILNTGFQIKKISYANMVLSIPLFVKRFVERMQKKKIKVSDTYLLNQVLNNILKAYLLSENKLLLKFNFPFGSSVIAIAKK